MKVKNIMFSGVMAAILMTASGAAMAEGEVKPVSVASTGYVDAKVQVVDTKIGTIPAGGLQVGAGNYTNVAAAIEALESKTEGVVGSAEMTNIQNSIATLTGNDSVDGSVKQQVKAAVDAQKLVDEAQDVKINANETAIGVLNADAQTKDSVAYKIANAVIQQAQVKDLDTALQGKADASDLTSLAGKVEHETTGLAATYTIATGNKEAIEGLTDETNGILAQAKNYADTEDDKIEAKIGEVAADTTVVAMIGDVSTSVTSLKGTEVKANQEAIAKLNGSVDAAGSVAHTAKETVEGYAIPKPGSNCANEKCVLSVDREGNPYWMELALSL